MKNTLRIFQLMLLFLTVCNVFPFFAQTIDLKTIKLDEFYDGNIDKVLTQIANKHKLTFNYDKSAFVKLEYSNRFFDTPLDKALEVICKKFRLKYFVSEDNVIHVLDVREKINANRLPAKRSESLPPTQFNITLNGKVNDKSTGESLPFVSLAVPGTPIGTTTNVDGFFTLIGVPSDTSTIAVSYIGYQTDTLYLRPGQSLKEISIELAPSSVSLTEVVVSAEREELMQANSATGIVKLTPAKINTLPSIGEKDIFRSFQLMPGISAANENTSGLYVRGGTPDQSLVTYDGFTVYNVDHLFGFFSAFNSNAIKDVQLHKSGFEAKYGGRLSSVVEITGKEGNRKNFNFGAEAGLLALNGFVEFPIGEKISFIATARRSWKSGLYNKIFEQFSGENEEPQGGPAGGGGFGNPFGGNTVASYFYDLNAKLTYRPSERDVLSFSFYNGADNLDNSIRPEIPSFLADLGLDFSLSITDLTNWGNTGTSLKWGRQWNDRLYSNSLVSYSTYFSKRDRTVDGSFTDADGNENEIKNGTLEDNDLKDMSFKSDWTYKLNAFNQLEFGIAYTYNDIAYTYAQNDTTTIIDRQGEGATISAYVQDRLSLMNNRLSLTPGLRVSRFDGTASVYYEPRLHAAYQLTDHVKLNGTVGRYYQFAKRVIREDIQASSRDFWVLADDERLPVTESWQYGAGVSYETQDYLFSADAYYKTFDGLSEYSLRFQPRLGEISYEEFFYQGTGFARGIDFLLQKKYGKWNGWIGYTLGDVRHNYEVYGENDFYAANDVTHEFKIINMLKWRRWDFSATWIYASGKPYTAPQGGYQVTLLDGTTQDYISISAKNGQRLPSYHRLDLAATYNFTMGERLSPATLSFSIFNVYDRNNVWYKEFQIVDNQIVETDVNYLGLTPNISFTYRLR